MKKQRLKSIIIYGLLPAMAFIAPMTRELPIAFGGALLATGLAQRLTPQAFFRMRRPGLWITMIIIALLTGAFLGKDPDWHVLGIGFSWVGVRSGILMIVRAYTLILIMSFWASSITIEKAGNFFDRIGFPQLTPAIQVAGNALPAVIERWGGLRKQRRHLFSKTVDIITATCREADYWGNVTPEAHSSATLKIIIVTGKRASGKTTCLKKLCTMLEQQNILFDGILQPATFEKNTKTGYFLEQLPEKKRIPLAKKLTSDTRDPRQPGYQFLAQGFLTARDKLSQLNQQAVHFVDELGLLEARGSGHLPATMQAMHTLGGKWVLSVRKNRLDQIIERLPEHQGNIFDLDECSKTPASEISVRESSNESREQQIIHELL